MKINQKKNLKEKYNIQNQKKRKIIKCNKIINKMKKEKNQKLKFKNRNQN